MAERQFPRRKILIGGIAVSGSAFLGYKLVDKITGPDPEFNEIKYIKEILKREHPPQNPFGAHLDRPDIVERERIKKAVGRLDLVGSFATFEQLLGDEGFRKHFFTEIRDTINFGAIPVANLGFLLPINGLHPFDNRNLGNMKQIARAISILFFNFYNECPTQKREIYIRWCYEANLPSFVYGTQKGLSDGDQVKGYKEGFNIFKEAFIKRGLNKIKMVFSPWMDNNFEDYFIETADISGFSSYWDLNILRIISGQIHTKDIVETSFQKMRALTEGKMPWYLMEIGSSQANRFLYEATLIAFANNADGIMHFNFNKSTSEVDWRMKERDILNYKNIMSLF